MIHSRRKINFVGVACASILASSLYAAAPILPRTLKAIPMPAAGKAGGLATYDFRDVLDHSVMSQAVDISDNKAIGGIYSRGDVTLTFVTWRGETISVRHGDAPLTLMGPVTNAGVTAGNWGDELVQHAGLYDLSRSQWFEFPDVPGKPINFGWRINEAGVVVGAACEGNLDFPSACTGWIWQGGGYQPLNVPGATSFIGTIPTSINNRGQIVGYYSDQTGFRSFVYDYGVFTTILPGQLSQAMDINTSGQIVLLTFPDPEAFLVSALYDRGAVTELPWFNGLPTIHLGLNDSGELVGVYFDGMPRAFVASRK